MASSASARTPPSPPTRPYSAAASRGAQRRCRASAAASQATAAWRRHRRPPRAAAASGAPRRHGPLAQARPRRAPPPRERGVSVDVLRAAASRHMRPFIGESGAFVAKSFSAASRPFFSPWADSSPTRRLFGCGISRLEAATTLQYVATQSSSPVENNRTLACVRCCSAVASS